MSFWAVSDFSKDLARVATKPMTPEKARNLKLLMSLADPYLCYPGVLNGTPDNGWWPRHWGYHESTVSYFDSWRFIDKTGKVAIPTKATRAKPFKGRIAFISETGRYGFRDNTGAVVIEPRYEQFRPFSEGLAAVMQNDRWGYIDRSGRVVIPFKYERTLGFSCGLAAVSVDGQWGYIKKEGGIIIVPQFAGASVFRNDRARVNIGGTNYRGRRYHAHYGDGKQYWVLDGAWRYIDKSGQFISDLKFDKAMDFRDGMAAFQIFWKCGLKDSAGRIVLPAEYDKFDTKFIAGMAKVKSRGRWGFINDFGKLVLPPVYEEVRDFVQGRAAVKAGTKWAFVDTSGKFTVKPQFGRVLDFSEGLAAVQFPPAGGCKKGKWGYIDTAGKTVIPARFDGARPFSESLASVRRDGRAGCIDKSGKLMIGLKFHAIRRFSNGVAAACQTILDGRGASFWGLIDKKGNWLVPPVFDNGPTLNSDMYSFKIGADKAVEVDRRGRVHLQGGDTISVKEHLTPALLKLAEGDNALKQRAALLKLSVLDGPQLPEILRKAAKSPDPYTSLIGVELLEEIAIANALDTILRRLHDRNAAMADRAADTAHLLVSDPLRAVAFLGKISSVPKKYRKQLLQRAALAITVGPRTPKSWKSYNGPNSLEDTEYSKVVRFFRDISDLSFFVDWRALADLSIEPDTEINLQAPALSMTAFWNEFLSDIRVPRVDCIVCDGVLIVSTRDRLRAIADTLSSQPSEGSKKPAENKATEKLLQTHVSDFRYEYEDLPAIFRFWCRVSGVKIDRDWTALGKSGIQPYPDVTVNLQNNTFDTALKLILLDIADPGVLTYKIDDGKVYIVKAPKRPAPPMSDPVKILTGALKRSDKDVRAAAAKALKELRK